LIFIVIIFDNYTEMYNQEIENFKTMKLDYIDFTRFIDEIMATDIVANYHNDKFKYNQPNKNNFYKFMTGLSAKRLPWHMDYWRRLRNSFSNLKTTRENKRYS